MRHDAVLKHNETKTRWRERSECAHWNMEGASYQVQEPIGDDERLATRRGDMPPPAPERVANPKNREDPEQYRTSELEKMHHATKYAYTKTWFDYCRSIFPQSVRKAGPDFDFRNVSTNPCSILSNNTGSLKRKSEFRKPENIDKPISSTEKFHVPSDPQLSLVTEFWGTTTHMRS